MRKARFVAKAHTSPAAGPNTVGKVKPEQLPFFAAQGSDPNALGEGDFQQQATHSTAPGTPPQKPKTGPGGAYTLKHKPSPPKKPGIPPARR